MRVIAGTARSIPLKSVEGRDTRPTTDRIKETLFNILQTELVGIRFLDLYAGSGGIGIEALSRGSKEAVFVDNSALAVACIKENLAKVKMIEQARVIRKDALSALSTLEGEKAFHIIFMDPPYGQGLEAQAMSYLGKSSLVDDYTIIIIESGLDSDYSYMEDYGFNVYRIKKYKTNQHVFLCKKSHVQES